MMKPFSRGMTPIVALGLLLAGPVASTAADKADGKSDLPGVKPPAPIVKPLPAEQTHDEKDMGGWVRMGDRDVRISGSVAVDIGTGPVPSR